MKYLYAQLPDLVKPCSRIRTQMENPEGQKVRDGGSCVWNGKDGLARKKWERKKRDPSGYSISYGSSLVLSEHQIMEVGMTNENLGKHEQ